MGEMSEADQHEALSRKYHCWGILKLSSGRYAIFSRSFELLTVVDDPREFDLTFDAANKYRMQYHTPANRPAPAKSVKLTTKDLLKDFGL